MAVRGCIERKNARPTAWRSGSSWQNRRRQWRQVPPERGMSHSDKGLRGMAVRGCIERKNARPTAWRSGRPNGPGIEPILRLRENK